MRKKDRPRKTKKVLIRLTKKEKDYAFSAAKKEGKDASKLMRELLNNYNKGKNQILNYKIARRYEKLLSEYRSMVDILLKSKTKRKH
jgi:hypothetical protein